MLSVSHEVKALRSYARRASDAIYTLCFYSIAAFSLALLLAGVVSVAVASNVVEVPTFHPR
jgi:hypothetical protein